VAEIFRLAALNWKSLTNGAEGILLSDVPPLVIGGVLIGATESLAGAYISSGLKDLVVYVLFLLILLFKPAGLFGKSRV
jgi:branched-subunit amino acid ABC-type transport system permease component